MKTMKARNDHRTSISLSDVVYKFAVQQMELKGFNGNMSSYVADLIRRDHEHQTPNVQPPEESLGATQYMTVPVCVPYPANPGKTKRR